MKNTLYVIVNIQYRIIPPYTANVLSYLKGYQ